MGGRHRDSYLPPDGDYPTGPIDVWPLLAEDAPAGALVDDNGALHDKRNGRFTKKRKAAAPVASSRPVVTRTFGTGEEARARTVRVFTWDEIKDLPVGPEPETQALWAERFPDGPPNFWEWPVEPEPEKVSVKVDLPTKPRPYYEPEAEWLRGWALRNGFKVKARGALPLAVKDAHRAEWEKQQRNS